VKCNRTYSYDDTQKLVKEAVDAQKRVRDALGTELNELKQVEAARRNGSRPGIRILRSRSQDYNKRKRRLIWNLNQIEILLRISKLKTRV